MDGKQNDQMDAASLDRRGIMKRAGMGALGLGALAASGELIMPKSASAQAVDQTVSILQFALNLEYLEAEFYLRALTGQGLADSDRTGQNGEAGGVVTAAVSTPGTMVPFVTDSIRQYAQTIAADERAHVEFLRGALKAIGGLVPSPAIDVGQAFTTLALAAQIIVPGQVFNPYANEFAFLVGAFIFEDVGVTAYAGAAASVNTTYLPYAASILAVEAYHSATVRTLLAQMNGGVAANNIANLRSMLSTGQPGNGASATGDDAGLIQVGGEVNLFPGDFNALAFRRTPRQVLNIVYGGTNATSGLFFPNGVTSTPIT